MEYGRNYLDFQPVHQDLKSLSCQYGFNQRVCGLTDGPDGSALSTAGSSIIVVTPAPVRTPMYDPRTSSLTDDRNSMKTCRNAFDGHYRIRNQAQLQRMPLLDRAYLSSESHCHTDPRFSGPVPTGLPISVVPERSNILQPSMMVSQDNGHAIPVNVSFSGCYNGDSTIPLGFPTALPMEQKSQPALLGDRNISHHSDTDDDTPINKLSRIARFNKVSLSYSLVDEKGPAHDKLFLAKVVLEFLDTQFEFVGEGKSIKKAQHAAALNALKCPRLRPVPEKSRYRIDQLKSADAPPVARLNALAVKLRSWANYKDTVVQSISFGQIGNLLWNSTVTMCGKSFVGWGMNKIISRNMAAHAALEYFEWQKENRDLVTRTAEPVPKVDDSGKSAITRLYECVSRMQKDVEFNYLACDGDGHNQIHRFKCIVETLETEGKGSSKRLAKHDAAEKMLAEFEKCIDTTRSSSNSAERKRRTNVVKSAKAKPEYGKHINPVCRLYQLQQAINEPDPVFEDGNEVVNQSSKVKEFTVNVKIPGGLMESGTGPSKKLAKRFAAENLLRALGYQLHCPVPTKSSLKDTNFLVPELAEGDKKVTFDLHNPECDDKQNGVLYRKRYSKLPHPASLYPKESVCEVLYEATSSIQPGRSLAPGLISLPRNRAPVNNKVPVNTISAIARELIIHSKSSTAEGIIKDLGRDVNSDELSAEPMQLLEYLCRTVNMTLSHETFSRQGPHCEFSTVLTVGDPVSSIGCGSGPSAELAMKGAAWNLLHVISEQGEVKECGKGMLKDGNGKGSGSADAGHRQCLNVEYWS